jgi:hypothetical protein
MMVNAMQEQPILLLPLFMIVYFLIHLAKQALDSLFAHSGFRTRLQQ